MKRLIYAAVILIFLISLSFYSHFAVDRYCTDTLNDIKNFTNQNISADTLTKSWHNRKEKMSIYVNHEFLDQISLNIDQLTLGASNKDQSYSISYQNIKTLLSLIRDEQQLSAHTFY